MILAIGYGDAPQTSGIGPGLHVRTLIRQTFLGEGVFLAKRGGFSAESCTTNDPKPVKALVFVDEDNNLNNPNNGINDGNIGIRRYPTLEGNPRMGENRVGYKIRRLTDGETFELRLKLG